MVWPSRCLWRSAPCIDCNLGSQLEIHVTEAFNHLLDYRDLVHLVELEGQCIDDMLLLVRCQRIVEELGLIVVLGKFDRTKALLDSLNLLRVSITAEKPM
jgi:hypothetical protein